MSAAIAGPPVAAALGSHSSSARTYATLAPSAATSASATPVPRISKPFSRSPPSVGGAQMRRTSSGEGKRSPNVGSLLRTSQIPQVVVKQEPDSPDPPTPRHRPSRLNLSNPNLPNGALSARPSAPLTSRDSAGLALHDVGLACLSPGFNTKDPSMREQLERSMSVREQQRKIIEARSKGGKAPGETDTPRHAPESSTFRPSAKTPGTGKRKGPPPGLTIAPPSHEQFANERVIQSAPLHMSFPRHATPLSRQVLNQPSNLGQISHIHHVPANKTNNRLPPISDVFPGELQQPGPVSSSRHSLYHSPGHSSHSTVPPPLPSPSYPPHPHTASFPHPAGTRPREFKSAEDAVQSMVGGREELLPRLVHYGGHQPPTPPSPKNSALGVSHSSTARRRDRDEYERDAGSPPLGRGPHAQQRRRGPFGEERDSPESQRHKKEEFIQLCARAWDLFHS